MQPKLTSRNDRAQLYPAAMMFAPRRVQLLNLDL